MKKQFIIITMLAAMSASAQIEKGTVLLGTDFSYTSTEEKYSGAAPGSVANPTSSEFRIAPYVGYFAVAGFVLGVQVDYTTSNEDNQSSSYFSDVNSQKSHTLGFGPLFRYYTFFGDKFCIQNALGLYVLSGEATYRYTNYNSYPYYGSYTTEDKVKLSGATGGYNLKVGYLIKESIGLQVSMVDLTYTTYRVEDKSLPGAGAITMNTFEFKSLLSAPQIGVEFYIRPKAVKK
jgi:hypothetical protein